MSRTSGLVRADGQTTSAALSSDLVLIQSYSSNSGQFEPRLITVSNLLTGGGTSFTEGSIIFADSTGSLAQDNTNFFWNDSTNTARITNVDLGVSGTAGSLDIFPGTAASGKLAFAAANNAGNTTTTITNASQAGARTYTLPDAGASASFVMTEGAQTINGAKTIPTLITTTFTATNIDAGASGTAGTVDVFPTTALKGKIQIAAVANTNDDTLTITNAAQAAARTYTIPDAGGAADFVMNAGTQTIAGAKTFSGNINITTAGALQADSITLSYLKWVDVDVTAAILDGAGTVPVIVGASGDRYKVRNIVLVGGGTNFGAGGDRAISLTDGTNVYTTVANADIESAPTASLAWGDAKVPFLTGVSNIASVAGQNIRFQYSGGTTDHTTGSISFSVCLEKVA
jgi:hypothetical protein